MVYLSNKFSLTAQIQPVDVWAVFGRLLNVF